jgi:hypothetical protein
MPIDNDTFEAELAEIDDNDPGSGSKLRRKLEEVLADNRELRGQVTASRAKDLISEKGLTFVKVDDLAAVPLDELETKAAELEETRRNDFETTLRSRFEAQGLSGDELDKTVSAIIDGQAPAQETGGASPQPPTADAITRQRQVTGGTTVPAVNPENLSTRQKFEHGLS